MKKRLTAVLAAIVLMLGISVMAAPTASAGTFCDVTGWCGRVYNSMSFNIKTTNTWPARTATTVIVKPGNWSPFTDTDGFYIPSGWCYNTVRGPVWKKISDYDTIWLDATVFYKC